MASRALRCEITSDPAAYWDRVAAFLLAEPVLNTVLITNVDSRRRGLRADAAPPTFVAVLDAGGDVIGAAMRTPPHNAALSAMPAEAVAPLVDAMLVACPDNGGVMARADLAEAFVAAWTERTGAGSEVRMRERLYRLDAVVQPPAPSGSWRLAEPADRPLIDRWSHGFAEDAGVESGESIAEDLARRVEDGRVYLWVDGGEPVSLTSAAQPAGGVVRVGPVYTPRDRRGRGYATALVAVVSQRALDAGSAWCTLFTDLANPTSNRIYQAIGYRPVCDIGMHVFTISRT